MPQSSRSWVVKDEHGRMGSRMMRSVMIKKNVESLESMIKTAVDNGVELVACQMSMDVMGIKKEEFVDGVQLGGVATYLERTEDAGVNLFV